MKLSFVQFSLICYKFCILSKTESKCIYHHFGRDHESSSFRKLARIKWICRETCDFFCDKIKVEQFHVLLRKQVLGVRKTTSNIKVLAEPGRLLFKIYIETQMFK